jgi:hypothetical protein
MSNADGIDTVPANPYSVTGEYGPAATAVSRRVLKRKTVDDILWGSTGKGARLLAKFCRLLSRMDKVTWEWCYSWHRRWRGGRPLEPNSLEVALRRGLPSQRFGILSGSHGPNSATWQRI